jgi:hypothetical protein
MNEKVDAKTVAMAMIKDGSVTASLRNALVSGISQVALAKSW